jgi:hypothetical protein
MSLQGTEALGVDDFDVDMNADMNEGYDDDKENVTTATDVLSTTANPGILTGASGVAGLGLSGTWERVALRDIVLECPTEYEEHDCSDIESSDGGEDMQSENLAELLEERIRQNEGGCYDFDIYCDP